MLNVDPATADVEIVPWTSKPRYGLPHQETIDAIELAATLEGLVLDPIYSGRAFTGLIAMVKSDRWSRDCNVVFVHTGGVLSRQVNSLGNVDSAA